MFTRVTSNFLTHVNLDILASAPSAQPELNTEFPSQTIQNSILLHPWGTINHMQALSYFEEHFVSIHGENVSDEWKRISRVTEAARMTVWTQGLVAWKMFRNVFWAFKEKLNCVSIAVLCHGLNRVHFVMIGYFLDFFVPFVFFFFTQIISFSFFI